MKPAGKTRTTIRTPTSARPDEGRAAPLESTKFRKHQTPALLLLIRDSLQALLPQGKLPAIDHRLHSPDDGCTKNFLRADSALSKTHNRRNGERGNAISLFIQIESHHETAQIPLCFLPHASQSRNAIPRIRLGS